MFESLKSLKQQKPTGEFFEKLGHYVYAYISRETGEWLYIGKGLGARVYDHVKEKEYDWEDAYLLDRNCENWGDGNKVALNKEGTYIKLFNPRDNKQAGHHKEEYYIMSRFDGLFAAHQDGQRIMVNEMAEFINANPIVLNNLGPTTSRPTGSWEVESGAHDSVYFGILYNMKSGFSFRIKTKDDEKMGLLKGIMTEYVIITEGTGDEKTVTYAVDDAEAVLELWTAVFTAKPRA